MIQAQRVLDVANFLEGGEHWQTWVDGYKTKVDIKLMDAGPRVSLSRLVRTTSGRYMVSMSHLLTWKDLKMAACPVASVAFKLATMESELKRNEISNS